MELGLLHQTDVFTTRPQTIFADRGAYAVLRTPIMPSYYSGNRLLLAAPITADQLDHWTAVFAQEFAGSGVRHIRLEWAGPEPPPADQAAFAAAGYEQTVLLGLTRAAPPPVVDRQPVALIIEPVREADAGPLKRFLLDCYPDWGAAFIDFVIEDIYLRLRTLEGGWWLGRLQGRIAGSMGLFFDGPLGRYQTVATHPAFRRQGVARTMVTELARQGFARPATELLVIAADRDYFAAQLYESCGFRTTHTVYELFKPPPP